MEIISQSPKTKIATQICNIYGGKKGNSELILKKKKQKYIKKYIYCACATFAPITGVSVKK